MEHPEAVFILGGAVAIFGLAYAIRVYLRLSQRKAEGAPAIDPADVPQVIAPPPLIALGFLAAAAVLETVAPAPPLPLPPQARYPVGALLLLVGIMLMISGARRFQAAGTNIPPTLPATALVIEGPYRRSRNPLYLAMALIYAGLAVAAASLWALLLLVPLLLVITYGVILREEAYLERKFGDRYRAYKARVRRWF